MDKLNILLPVDSFLILEDKKLSVDILRMKKDHLEKNFKIQFFFDGELTKSFQFYKMTIKLKEIDSKVVFNISDENQNIIIESRKILPTKDLRKYIDTMII